MRKRGLLELTLAATLVAGYLGLPCLWPGESAFRAEERAALSARPADWARPIAKKGVPNLHKVSDTLYRSAQPTAEGMKNLKAMGIKTVVSLRAFHSDRDEIGQTGLAYEHIPVISWDAEEDEVVRFLRIVTDATKAPVLVHCQHGADRTGTMCAVYRIAVQGWSKRQALQEMTEGGYGFHKVWQNLLRFVDRLDIEKIRREAAVKASPK